MMEGSIDDEKKRAHYRYVILDVFWASFKTYLEPKDIVLDLVAISRSILGEKFFP